MAVNYRTSLKSTRMAAVVTDIGAAGILEICSAGFASVLATIALPNPAFTESGGVLTLADVPLFDTSADNSGTAAVARIKDGSGNVIVNNLSVGVGTGDVQLNSVTIVATEAVTITSGTITHSA